MAVEIERKFLVLDQRWRAQADAGTEYQQGYLASNEKCSLRVRLEGEEAKLNIKGATLGIRRQEFEYPIPVSDCRELLNTLCTQPLLHKTRYLLPYGEHQWEIDVFHGDNKGLVVAEIELHSETEAFARPPWLGDEVSHDPRYYNVSLVKHPFKDW